MDIEIHIPRFEVYQNYDVVLAVTETEKDLLNSLVLQLNNFGHIQISE